MRVLSVRMTRFPRAGRTKTLQLALLALGVALLGGLAVPAQDADKEKPKGPPGKSQGEDRAAPQRP